MTETLRTTTLRIGVTGHRDLADPEAARLDSIAAIEDLRRLHGGTVEVEILSSLAEGADRIVAGLVPDHAQRLVVVLPLDVADYRRDFPTLESCRQFDELLGRADRVEVAPLPQPTAPTADDTRESAYERAGLAIVERCDVLLALWDGGPSRGRGGTAEIVRAAHERGRVVMQIPVARAGAT